MKKKMVTIMVPCYNEESSLVFLYEELKKLMIDCCNYSFEILFVNDGSRDRTLEIIKSIKANDSRVSYIDLSRNFGKERAMLAGFDYAQGDCMVIIDADLQHPPTLIPEMLEKWEAGYEDVYAKRITRGKESKLRQWLSLSFYSLLSKISDHSTGGVLQNVGDFRLLDRKCIDALKSLRESERYTKGMYSWIGFKKTELLFEQADRIAGESSFNFSRLLGLAINGITSFTVAPLRLSIYGGIILSCAAFIYMIYVLVKTIIYGDPVQGYPSLMIVMLFLSGFQLLMLGIIGEYIGKAFNEIKNRPVYIVREYEK